MANIYLSLEIASASAGAVFGMGLLSEVYAGQVIRYGYYRRQA